MANDAGGGTSGAKKPSTTPLVKLTNDIGTTPKKTTGAAPGSNGFQNSNLDKPLVAYTNSAGTQAPSGGSSQSWRNTSSNNSWSAAPTGTQQREANVSNWSGSPERSESSFESQRDRRSKKGDNPPQKKPYTPDYEGYRSVSTVRDSGSGVDVRWSSPTFRDTAEGAFQNRDVWTATKEAWGQDRDWASQQMAWLEEQPTAMPDTPGYDWLLENSTAAANYRVTSAERWGDKSDVAQIERAIEGIDAQINALNSEIPFNEMVQFGQNSGSFFGSLSESEAIQRNTAALENLDRAGVFDYTNRNPNALASFDPATYAQNIYEEQGIYNPGTSSSIPDNAPWTPDNAPYTVSREERLAGLEKERAQLMTALVLAKGSRPVTELFELTLAVQKGVAQDLITKPMTDAAGVQTDAEISAYLKKLGIEPSQANINSFRGSSISVAEAANIFGGAVNSYNPFSRNFEPWMNRDAGLLEDIENRTATLVDIKFQVDQLPPDEKFLARATIGGLAFTESSRWEKPIMEIVNYDALVNAQRQNIIKQYDVLNDPYADPEKKNLAALQMALSGRELNRLENKSVTADVQDNMTVSSELLWSLFIPDLTDVIANPVASIVGTGLKKAMRLNTVDNMTDEVLQKAIDDAVGPKADDLAKRIATDGAADGTDVDTWRGSASWLRDLIRRTPETEVEVLRQSFWDTTGIILNSAQTTAEAKVLLAGVFDGTLLKKNPTLGRNPLADPAFLNNIPLFKQFEDAIMGADSLAANVPFNASVIQGELDSILDRNLRQTFGLSAQGVPAGSIKVKEVNLGKKKWGLEYYDGSGKLLYTSDPVYKNKAAAIAARTTHQNIIADFAKNSNSWMKYANGDFMRYLLSSTYLGTPRNVIRNAMSGNAHMYFEDGVVLANKKTITTTLNKHYNGSLPFEVDQALTGGAINPEIAGGSFYDLGGRWKPRNAGGKVPNPLAGFDLKMRELAYGGSAEIPIGPGKSIGVSEGVMRSKAFFHKWEEVVYRGARNTSKTLSASLAEMGIDPEKASSIVNVFRESFEEGGRNNILSKIRKMVRQNVLPVNLREIGIEPKLLHGESSARLNELIQNTDIADPAARRAMLNQWLDEVSASMGDELTASKPQPGTFVNTKARSAQNGAWVSDTLEDALIKAGVDKKQARQQARQIAGEVIKAEQGSWEVVRNIAASLGNEDSVAINLAYWRKIESELERMYVELDDLRNTYFQIKRAAKSNADETKAAWDRYAKRQVELWRNHAANIRTYADDITSAALELEPRDTLREALTARGVDQDTIDSLTRIDVGDKVVLGDTPLPSANDATAAPTLPTYTVKQILKSDSTPSPAPAPATQAAGFETAQGSTYTWDGRSTTRNKSLHQGHDPGDVGIKEPSSYTVFIDPKDATVVQDALYTTKPVKGTPRNYTLSSIKMDQGTLTFRFTDPQGEAAEQVFSVPVKSQPEIGVQPVEVWETGRLNAHLGNKITKVNGQAAARVTGEAAQATVPARATRNSGLTSYVVTDANGLERVVRPDQIAENVTKTELADSIAQMAAAEGAVIEGIDEADSIIARLRRENDEYLSGVSGRIDAFDPAENAIARLTGATGSDDTEWWNRFINEGRAYYRYAKDQAIEAYTRHPTQEFVDALIAAEVDVTDTGRVVGRQSRILQEQLLDGKITRAQYDAKKNQLWGSYWEYAHQRYRYSVIQGLRGADETTIQQVMRSQSGKYFIPPYLEVDDLRRMASLTERATDKGDRRLLNSIKSHLKIDAKSLDELSVQDRQKVFKYYLDEAEKQGVDVAKDWYKNRTPNLSDFTDFEDAENFFDAMYRTEMLLKSTGGTAAPSVDDYVRTYTRHAYDAAKKVDDNADMIAAGRPNTLTPKEQQQIMATVTRLLGEYDNVLGDAEKAGREYMNRIMLNYRNRRGFDEALKVGFPFHYFWSRSLVEWGKRVMRKPSVAYDLWLIDRAVQIDSEQYGGPARTERSVPNLLKVFGDNVGAPDAVMNLLPDRLYNPAAYVIPYNPINDFIDPSRANNDFEETWRHGQRLLPGMHPYINYITDAAFDYYAPIENGWKRTDTYELGDYLPPYRLAGYGMMAATGNQEWALGGNFITNSLTGNGTAPGYGPNFLNAGDVYVTGLVGRSLRNKIVSGEVSGTENDLAQAWLSTMMGGGPVPPELLSRKEELLPIIHDAARDAGGDKFATQFVSLLLGLSGQMFPMEERQARELEQIRRELGYSYDNPWGSQMAQEAFDQITTTSAGIPYDEVRRGNDYSQLYVPPQKVKVKVGLEDTVEYTAQTLNNLRTVKWDETQAVYDEMNQATIDFISDNRGLMTRQEILDAVNEVKQPFYDQLKEIDSKYPSVPLGRTRGQAYTYGANPFEEANAELVKILSYEPPGKPTYPGENATTEQLYDYYIARGKWDDAYSRVMERTMQQLVLEDGPTPSRSDMALARSLIGRRVTEVIEAGEFRRTPAELIDLEMQQRVYNETMYPGESLNDKNLRIENQFGRDGALLLAEYNALPKPTQEERDKGVYFSKEQDEFRDKNPEVDEIRYFANYPDEYEKAVELFGDDIFELSGSFPGGGSKEEKKRWYNSHSESQKDRVFAYWSFKDDMEAKRGSWDARQAEAELLAQDWMNLPRPGEPLGGIDRREYEQLTGGTPDLTMFPPQEQLRQAAENQAAPPQASFANYNDYLATVYPPLAGSMPQGGLPPGLPGVTTPGVTSVLQLPQIREALRTGTLSLAIEADREAAASRRGSSSGGSGGGYGGYRYRGRYYRSRRSRGGGRRRSSRGYRRYSRGGGRRRSYGYGGGGGGSTAEEAQPLYLNFNSRPVYARDFATWLYPQQQQQAWRPSGINRGFTPPSGNTPIRPWRRINVRT